MPTATNVNSVGTTAASTKTTTSSTSSADATSDRFLRLLVAQMQNQDPMNPMDNAEVTTQMAQINTVTGLDKVNSSINSLASQFTQLQTMQATSLVGKHVEVQGNQLQVEDGKVSGAFALANDAEKVTVTVMDAAGNPIKKITLDKGSYGRNEFSVDVPNYDDGKVLTYKVEAQMKDKTGAMVAVQYMPFMVDKIESVSSTANGLTLRLERSDKNVAYEDVTSFRD